MVRPRSATPLSIGSNPIVTSRTKQPNRVAFFVLEVTINCKRCFRLRKLHRSNLKAKSKRLSIVLTTLFAPKQGVWRVWHLGKRRQTTMRRVRKSPRSNPIWLLFSFDKGSSKRRISFGVLFYGDGQQYTVLSPSKKLHHANLPVGEGLAPPARWLCVFRGGRPRGSPKIFMIFGGSRATVAPTK